MAKKKADPAVASERPATTNSTPVSSPKKRLGLLSLAIGLLAVWLLVLAWLALFGEARFGE